MRYFLILIPAFALFSCKDNSNSSLAAYRAAEEGLQQSNKMISRSNKIIYADMENKLADPGLTEIMKNLLPKALKVRELSDSMINYIERLKEEMVSEAGPVKQEDKKIFESNLTVSDHLFDSHGKGKELFEKVMKYKQDMLAIDLGSKNKFEDKFILFTKEFDEMKEGGNGLTKAFFHNVPAIAAITTLTKFENDIKIIENNFVTYYNSSYSNDAPIFDRISFLIGQSTNYLKAGDNLTITAGIGAFASAVKSKIIINNANIPIVEGMAEYNLKAPLKPGKYAVPIIIDYEREDGKTEHVAKSITYTVLE